MTKRTPELEAPNLDGLFDRLFPLLRSITGPGFDQSLAILSEYIPLETTAVPSGTKVFDWTVPEAWECRSAQLTAPDGTVIADMADTNLHVLNYSSPIEASVTLDELDKHLYSLPHLPTAIPYTTTYYHRRWGFCLPHNVRESLQPSSYTAKIDSSLTPGDVKFGQTVLEGESEKEILICFYLCHPSLANNELRGPLVLTGLYDRLRRWSRRRYTYRFVINPETIGSLCVLHTMSDHLRHTMVGGLVLTCMGGPENTLSYKMSRNGCGLFDTLILGLIDQGEKDLSVRPFDATEGSDERQYCSPGFDLPVGQFVRTKYGQYDGYHNSLDDKAFMDIGQLEKSVERLERILMDAEIAGPFENLAQWLWFVHMENLNLAGAIFIPPITPLRLGKSLQIKKQTTASSSTGCCGY